MQFWHNTPCISLADWAAFGKGKEGLYRGVCRVLQPARRVAHH